MSIELSIPLSEIDFMKPENPQVIYDYQRPGILFDMSDNPYNAVKHAINFSKQLEGWCVEYGIGKKCFEVRWEINTDKNILHITAIPHYPQLSTFMGYGGEAGTLEDYSSMTKPNTKLLVCKIPGLELKCNMLFPKCSEKMEFDTSSVGIEAVIVTVDNTIHGGIDKKVTDSVWLMGQERDKLINSFASLFHFVEKTVPNRELKHNPVMITQFPDLFYTVPKKVFSVKNHFYAIHILDTEDQNHQEHMRMFIHSFLRYASDIRNLGIDMNAIDGFVSNHKTQMNELEATFLKYFPDMFF